MLGSLKPKPNITDEFAMATAIHPQAQAQPHSLEARLLLCCARLKMDDEAIEVATELIRQGVNTSDLAQLANNHRVLPLLSYSLQKNSSLPISPSAQQQLQLSAQRYAMQNMVLTKTLTDVITQLASIEVKAIPFKGPVLALMAYNNLALRQIGDLDLLVDRKDSAAVVALLTKQGYRQTVDVPWETHLDSPDGRHNLDIHHDVVPQHLSCFAEETALWKDLTSVQLLGKTVETFSPERLLFVLCLNGTKEKWCKLNRICDIAALVQTQSLGWPAVMAEAKQRGCQRLIKIGLLLAHQLLSAPLSESVCRWIESDRTAQRLAHQLQTDLFASHPVEVGEVQRSFFHIRTRERLPDKLKTLIGLLNHSGWLTPTPNDYNAFPLPHYLSFLYYVIRPLRVIKKYYWV